MLLLLHRKFTKASISIQDWYDWTDDQVLNWLRKIDISSEGFVHWDNEIRLNGKNLKMYYRDLVEKYDFNLNDANLIQREIEKLKVQIFLNSKASVKL
jgi:hypothetical protein